MAKSLSFSDMIVVTARQKAEAARVRRHSVSAGERPGEVILAACTAIGERMREDGFSFLRSGLRMKRVREDLTFAIRFQSDRNNIAGHRAAVWIHCGVSSRRLAEWRRRHPDAWIRREGPEAGWIVGAQIGNLGPSPCWMEWDFADKATRESQVDDAVAAIRRIILPFFARFDDPAGAVADLVHDPGTEMLQPSILEYALSSLGREAAEAAGRSCLESSPVIRSQFDAAWAEFKAKGLPGYRSTLGSDLAALAIITGLDLRAGR